MENWIRETVKESIAVKQKSVEHNLPSLLEAVRMLAACIAGGNKVLIFGNGGSAADAQHIAAEFVNRFRIERPPLAAIALTTDTSILTSIGNDYRFEDVFSKQILALGGPGDVAWGISTSGNSENVLQGFSAAREQGLATFGMTGKGGKMADLSDVLLTVDSDITARIQETHILYAHLICELLDRKLFQQ